ncbi:MAG: transposon-transfer assisting family protein [Oscillospiraceae bacterium]|jgi:hypothetical protein|nr:transposon-transfer assisting family protein [Oscillospiraceae bacterium]
MTFTTQERRLIALYRSDTREATAAQFREALPYIDERDVRAAAESAARKLTDMIDLAFADEFAGRYAS